jgi:hypothetical protein
VNLETLRFLRDLVSQQQISANNPDLVAVARLVSQVKEELDQAIEEERE